MKNNFFIKLLFWGGVSVVAVNLGLYIDSIKDIAVLIFGALFILAIFKTKKKTIPRVVIIWFVLLLLCYLICFIDPPQRGYDTAKELAIPFLVCFSSMVLFDSDLEDFTNWFIPFSVLAGYCAVMSVIRANGSMVILDYYSDMAVGVEKNQTAPFFCLISITALMLSFQTNKKLIIKLYLVAVSVLCILPSIYLSARTPLFATLIASAFIVFEKFKFKGLMVMFFGVLALLLISNSISDLLYNSIVGNRDASDLNSLSSGRMDRLDEWKDFFSQYPLFGQMESPIRISRTHVFLLWKFVQYGIIGSLPFVLIYVLLIKQFAKSIKLNDLICAGVLFIALFDSLGEFSAPFGPGTTYVFCYVVLGRFFRNNYLIKEK